MRKLPLALILVAMGSGALVFAWQTGAFTTAPEPELSVVPATQPGPATSTLPTPNTRDAEVLSQQLVDQTAQRLQAQYGATIGSPATQVSLLRERDALRTAHPQFGDQLFEAAIELAFPELAAIILQRVENMAEYIRWETDMYLTLNAMEQLEREGTLWDKRQALFGDAAQDIWRDETKAIQRSQRLVQGELERLDTATDLTLDDTLLQLQSVVDENVDALSLEAFGQPALRSTLAGAFFGLGSVQQQLAALPDDARQDEIDRLRQNLGYSASEVTALAERDRKRNEKWQRGNAYMAEREALANQYAGAQLERQLDEARTQYLGRDAVTIAREEAEGFYRYARPRVFGRN